MRARRNCWEDQTALDSCGDWTPEVKVASGGSEAAVSEEDGAHNAIAAAEAISTGQGPWGSVVVSGIKEPLY